MSRAQKALELFKEQQGDFKKNKKGNYEKTNFNQQ
jgi:hypothetical protein